MRKSGILGRGSALIHSGKANRMGKPINKMVCSNFMQSLQKNIGKFDAKYSFTFIIA